MDTTLSIFSYQRMLGRIPYVKERESESVFPLSNQVLYANRVRVNALTMTPGGETLVMGSWDGRASVWKRQDNGKYKIQAYLQGHQGIVSGVAIDARGERILSGSHDSTARLWDYSTQKGWMLEAVLTEQSPIDSVAMDPEGRLLVTGTEEKTVRIWSYRRRKWQAKVFLSDHMGAVECMAMHVSGNLLVTGSEDKTARLYLQLAPQRWRLIATLFHERAVVGVCFDGESVKTKSASGKLYSWRVDKKKFVQRERLLRELYQKGIRGCFRDLPCCLVGLVKKYLTAEEETALEQSGVGRRQVVRTCRIL